MAPRVENLAALERTGMKFICYRCASAIPLCMFSSLCVWDPYLLTLGVPYGQESAVSFWGGSPVTCSDYLPTEGVHGSRNFNHSGCNSDSNTFHLKIFIKIKIKSGKKKKNSQNAALCTVLQESEKERKEKEREEKGPENPLCSSQRVGRGRKLPAVTRAGSLHWRAVEGSLVSGLPGPEKFPPKQRPKSHSPQAREQIFPRVCKLQEFDWRTGIWEQYSESLRSLKRQRPCPRASNCAWVPRSAGRS